MGRKKIEIRPLHDERNRNVTFLKRKAGLMKKAWELSVLCGADVSIVIFSAAGKAFEFSSKELDGELDRYFEYEGVIERRRAPEFAAMAEADEDDDDDDDDAPTRRGSVARPPGVTKSLKGKESFKPRMHSQGELARLVAKRERNKERDKHRSKDKHRSRDADYRKPTSMRTTVEEGGESSQGSSAEDDGYGEGKRRRKSRESRSHRDASMAGLQYAMNLHNRPSSSASHPGEQNGLPPMGRLPATAYNYRVQHPSQMEYSPDYSQAQSYPPNPSYGVQTPSYDRSSGMPNYVTPLTGSSQPPLSQHHNLPTPVPMPNGTPGGNLLPGNMQWDPQLLARYAEFQLHQNHQRQQRALLEQQRQQLAELGIPVEDKSLLDQLFGNNPNGTPTGESGDMATSSSNTMMPDEEMASQSYSSTNQSFDSGHQPFEWPNVNGAPEREGEERDEGLYKQLTALVNASRSGSQPGEEVRGKEEHWGADEFAPFPSPASAGDLRAVR